MAGSTSDLAVERLLRSVSSLLGQADAVSETLFEIYRMPAQGPEGHRDEWEFLMRVRGQAIQRIQDSLRIHGGVK